MTYNELKNELNNKRYEPISPDELNDLVINHKDEPGVKDRVICSLQRLIILMVGRHFYWETDPDALLDFVQIANEGLLDAYTRYDNKHIDFSSYAYGFARNKIRTYVKRKQPIVRATNIKGEMFYAQMSGEDTIPELTYEKESQFIHEEFKEVVALVPLDELHKDVFCHYYGIGTRQHTHQEIAKLFGWKNGESSARRVKRVLKEIKEDPGLKELFREYFE